MNNILENYYRKIIKYDFINKFYYVNVNEIPCIKKIILNFGCKNIEIKNINKIELNTDDHLFHAGTVKRGDVTLAVGGRVLNFVSLSDSFEVSRNRIHQLLNNLNWSDGFFRKDIGYKVIKK